MSKIIISTLVWKRPEIFEIWAENISNLKPKPEVLICGSDGDQCAEICRRYGFHYTTAPNKLLGRKANASVELGRNLEWDYMILTGSDDILDQKMWDYYQSFQGEVLGLSDYYFLNLPDMRMIYWGGYKDGRRNGEPIGACKLIRRDIIEKMDYKPFSDVSLHPDEHHTQEWLKKNGIETTTVKVSQTGGMSFDLKSESNISKFQLWRNSQYVNAIQTISPFPDLFSLLQSKSKKFDERVKEATKLQNRRNR